MFLKPCFTEPRSIHDPYDPTKPYPTNDQIFNALAAQLSILDLWPLIVRAMPRCKPDPVWVEKLKEGW